MFTGEQSESSWELTVNIEVVIGWTSVAVGLLIAFLYGYLVGTDVGADQALVQLRKQGRLRW